MENAVKKMSFCSCCCQLQGYRRYVYLITVLVGWGLEDELTSQLTNVDWKMITISMYCGAWVTARLKHSYAVDKKQGPSYFLPFSLGPCPHLYLTASVTLIKVNTH